MAKKRYTMYNSNEGMEECEKRGARIIREIGTVESGSALRDEMPEGVNYTEFQDRNVNERLHDYGE